jgi:hypothetical protein
VAHIKHQGMLRCKLAAKTANPQHTHCVGVQESTSTMDTKHGDI